MDMDGIMLTEISQAEKDRYSMWHLKILNSQTQRVKWWFPGDRRYGQCGDIGQKINTVSYKMHMFWGSVTTLYNI